MSKFFFIGDSHTGALKQGADIIGIPNFGNALIPCSKWLNGDFSFTEDGNLTIADQVGEELLRKSCLDAGVNRLSDLKIPIVTTLPFLMERDLRAFNRRHTTNIYENSDKIFLSYSSFRASIISVRADVISFLEGLVNSGVEVHSITPPSRMLPSFETFALQDVVEAELSRIGVTVHRTRNWSTDHEGILLTRYCIEKEGDFVHANSEYGAEAISRLLSHAKFTRGFNF